MYSLKVCKRAGGENCLSHRGGKIIAARKAISALKNHSSIYCISLENSLVTQPFLFLSVHQSFTIKHYHTRGQAEKQKGHSRLLVKSY